MKPYFETELGKLYCGDCLEVMKEMPDKSVDLVLTDPPYGINIIERGGTCGGRDSKTKKAKMGDYSNLDNSWDKIKPKEEYFKEIFRVSKDQIIFGANHFIESMSFNASCWLVWDKDNEASSFADCELAWTSFKRAVKKYKWRWNGMLQEKMKYKERRYHPTQKPVGLFLAIILDWSKENLLILDPFLGSGTTAICCEKSNRQWVGIEKDESSCEIAARRIDNEARQGKLF